MNPFQLRSSIKGTTGFGGSIYSNPTINSPNTLNQSQRNNPNGQHDAIVSPKVNKSYEINYEDAKNLMMKKRSPTKN